jgi:GNAT superfamily N-acetyltransferase
VIGESGDRYTLSLAVAADAAALAEMRTAAADRLTEDYGLGHWSARVTERGVLSSLQHARVLVLRDGDDIVATLRLATKKPWAIDKAAFTPVERAIYLTDMAVDPRRQREGLGRRLMREAEEIVRGWPAEAIRLDAYDDPAGAGPFYAKCGYREVARVVFRGVPLIYYEKLTTNN